MSGDPGATVKVPSPAWAGAAVSAAIKPRTVQPIRLMQHIIAGAGVGAIPHRGEAATPFRAGPGSSVTARCESGSAWQIRSALDELGHETFVLARPTRAKNIRPAFIDHSGVWAQPNVTDASEYRIPAAEMVQWGAANELDVEQERYAGFGIESPRVRWGIHPDLRFEKVGSTAAVA